MVESLIRRVGVGVGVADEDEKRSVAVMRVSFGEPAAFLAWSRRE